MISQDECSAIIDVAVKHGVRKKADGVEVNVYASDVATSRFANNGMTQNQSPQSITVSVRLQKNGKQARLTTDQISPAGVRALVENALTAARFLEPDANMLPVTAPEKKKQHKSVNRYDSSTAKFTAEQRAKAVSQIVKVAEKSGLISAGVFATGTMTTAIGNSTGLFRYHRETHAETSITMLRIDSENGGESTGWAKAQTIRVADIDHELLAKRAAEKAIASANPAEVEPGKYTVVLEPSAVLDLVSFLWYDFSATSHIDKLSCFVDKIGQRVLGENINIVDDAYHALQTGFPFDGEGLQRQVVNLVENGVVKNLVSGRRSALKLGQQGTGHGLSEPTAEGEMPLNLVFGGGKTSLDEMIRTTQRGILLTRVWYVREVDPTSKIETGMTRDGTFLIEDGVIKSGIRNMRFNESLIDMLNHVVSLGPAERAAGEEAFPSVVPAMKVENFNFTSVTRF